MTNNGILIKQLIDSFRNNDHRQIEELIAQAADSYTKEPQIQLIAGMSKYANGKFSAAKEIFTELIQAFPKYADAYNNLGLVNKMKGEIAEAKKNFREAIALNPNSPLGYTNLGNVQVLDHQYKEAITQYRSALEINSNYHVAKANLGNCYRLIGDYKTSISVLKECLISHPNYATGYTYLSMTYMAISETDNARFAIDKSLKISPANTKAQIVSGEIHFYEEKYEEAFKCFLEVVEKEPWQDEAWVGLGKIYASRGENKKSIECYKKALSCELVGVQAKANLANVLITAGLYSEAKTLLLETLKEIPNDKFLNYNLGVQYFTEHNYPDAIKYLSKSSYIHADKFLLEAYFKNNDLEKFKHLLKSRLQEKDACNAQIGSLCSRAKYKWKIETINPYCSAPLDLIYRKNLIDRSDTYHIINTCIRSLDKKKYGEAKQQGRLTNGLQTAGNIFTSTRQEIVRISEIIRSNVQEYRELHSSSSEPFLKNWPGNYVIQGWIISMEKGGSLNRHMHETSWLTGTLYLNIPEKINGDEGSIVVSMTDEKEDCEESMRVIKPRTGDFLLFPASLQHNTIPFNSNERRIVLAFDVLPR